MYDSLAYRSIAIARAAHFPFLSLSLRSFFPPSLSSPSTAQHTRFLTIVKRGTVNPLPLVRLSLLVGSPPLCSPSSLSTTLLVAS